MDVEVKAPVEINASPNMKETAEEVKLKPKPKSKRRSRSKTPNLAENKSLRISIKQCESEMNGNTAPVEEKPETTENDSNALKPDENATETTETQPAEGTANDDSFKRVTRSQTTEEEKDAKKQAKDDVTTESVVEMEPLVIDDSEPELQFDESPNKERDSPVLSGRTARRPRNATSPKTPKTQENNVDSEKSTPQIEITDSDTPKEDTYDSSDLTNSSTRALVGSDLTRLAFNEVTPAQNKREMEDGEELDAHDDSYLQELREKSYSDTLRSLSGRRPIRDDYRRMALNRSDLNFSYSTGLKRKNRSLTPEEESKKFKSDTASSFFSSLRSKFLRSDDGNDDTPQLTGYKDTNNELHFEEGIENGVADKKNWCNIM